MIDELDRLRSFRSDSVSSEDARRDARAALMAAVSAERSDREEAAAARTRRLRRRPRVVVAVAVSAVVLGGVVAALSGLDQGSVEPAPATARAALERAAVVAARGEEVSLAPGEYWHSRSEHVAVASAFDRPLAGAPGGVAPAYTVLVRFRRDVWLGADGGGRIRHEPLAPPEFLDDADRRGWIEAGRPPLETGADIDRPVLPYDGDGAMAKPYPLGSTALSRDELRALPTDTTALSDRLRAAIPDDRCTNRPSVAMPCAPDDAGMSLFQMIGGLLRETPAPPDLRAALYRVAAQIPGIRLASRRADSRDRTGVAVSLANPYERRSLVFDPDTAALLAERTVTLRDQAAPGVPGSTIPAGTETTVTYLGSGPAGSTGDRL